MVVRFLSSRIALSTCTTNTTMLMDGASPARVRLLSREIGLPLDESANAAFLGLRGDKKPTEVVRET